MAKLNYFKRSDFKKYLKEIKGKSNYEGYIQTIYDKILTYHQATILIDDLGKCLGKDSAKAFEGLETLHEYMINLYSIYNYQGNKHQPIDDLIRNEYKMTPKSFRDYATGLRKFIDFLKTLSFKKCRYAVTGWNQAVKSLSDFYFDKVALNGVDSLMSKFKDHKDFIETVLRDSYFFASQLAKDRFDYIANQIGQGIVIDARNSTNSSIQIHKNGKDYFCYTDEITKQPGQIEINIDPDGNRAVRDLIKGETGYTISAGSNSLFTNYIISHIWGDAFDPRNFTNYWNIALVPAWANNLLDKTNSQDTLTQQVINTFKAICVKHYKMKGYSWKTIYKLCPTYDPTMVLPGTYDINVIHAKGNNNIGRIKKVLITI